MSWLFQLHPNVLARLAAAAACGRRSLYGLRDAVLLEPL